MRVCSACERKLPPEAYSPKRPARCRECVRADQRRWANARNARDPGRAREQARKWRAANPEKTLELQRRSYAKHAEKRREENRAYKAENRARCTERQMNRKAILLEQFEEHVDSLVVLERADGACGICGGDLDPLDFHVDHVVPLALGGFHSYANTQPAHPLCNTRKGARFSKEAP